jgi:hypothetical protein
MPRRRVAAPPARRYHAAPGAPFHHKDAQKIGLRLESLEARGGVTPEAIVADAQDESSPLHPHFAWDDTQAARLYRLRQARDIANHLVCIVTRGGRETATKGWHSVVISTADERPARRAYASLATVENSPDLREQVVAHALRELEYWQKRYREYDELLSVREAVAAALDSATTAGV